MIIGHKAYLVLVSKKTKTISYKNLNLKVFLGWNIASLNRHQWLSAFYKCNLSNVLFVVVRVRYLNLSPFLILGDNHVVMPFWNGILWVVQKLDSAIHRISHYSVDTIRETNGVIQWIGISTFWTTELRSVYCGRAVVPGFRRKLIISSQFTGFELTSWNGDCLYPYLHPYKSNFADEIYGRTKRKSLMSFGFNTKNTFSICGMPKIEQSLVLSSCLLL